MGRLVINGEEVYELDENCMKEKRGQNMQAGEKRRYTETMHLTGKEDGPASKTARGRMRQSF